jgi:chitin synthase
LATQKITENDLGVVNAVLRTSLPDFLNRYCISIDPESDEAMLYNENVYLAEDRILCMGIHKKGFDMAFLPDAYAEVDPIKTVHGLLGQRKRWINGSYFAFEKVKKELSAYEKENGCEFFLNLQILYLTFMNSMSYFSPALFMFTVHIAIQAFRYDVLSRWLSSAISPDVLDFFVYTVDFIYVMMISSIIFYSLHFKNNVKEFKYKIYLVSTVFGIFMLIIMGVLLVDIVSGLINNSSRNIYLT